MKLCTVNSLFCISPFVCTAAFLAWSHYNYTTITNHHRHNELIPEGQRFDQQPEAQVCTLKEMHGGGDRDPSTVFSVKKNKGTPRDWEVVP
jgi:hypothetical protein